MKKLLKTAVRFARKNILLDIFILTACFVVVFAGYKTFFSKQTFVHVKVKVGQGYWWASTQKPGLWFLQSIQQAKTEKDLAGKTIAEVEDVTYYPNWVGNQYDVYVTARLRVSEMGKTGKYNFKRTTIGVGSPIDFEFSTVQFSGTIIQLSDKPIHNEYLEKTVTLTKKGAYPWEFDAIRVGDSVNNGKTVVCQILDKQASDTLSMTSDQYGNLLPSISENKLYIIVKVRVKVQKEGDRYVYGEEQVLTRGRGISCSTDNYAFADFTVASIE